MLNTVITKVYTSSEITLVTLREISSDINVLSQVFTSIAQAGINIDMINQTPPLQDTISISFTIADEDLPKVLIVIGKYQKQFPGLRTDINSGNCKVLLYGEKMVETPGVGAWAFNCLAQKNIQVKLITTSDVDISLLIDGGDESLAIESFGANNNTNTLSK